MTNGLSAIRFSAQTFQSRHVKATFINDETKKDLKDEEATKALADAKTVSWGQLGSLFQAVREIRNNTLTKPLIAAGLKLERVNSIATETDASTTSEAQQPSGIRQSIRDFVSVAKEAANLFVLKIWNLLTDAQSRKDKLFEVLSSLNPANIVSSITGETQTTEAPSTETQTSEEEKPATEPETAAPPAPEPSPEPAESKSEE